MAEIATVVTRAPPLAVATEVLLFAGAGLISLLAFTGWILAPALGAYGRPWEKAAAAFLSLFVLGALVALGIAIGFVIFFYWNEIVEFVNL